MEVQKSEKLEFKKMCRNIYFLWTLQIIGRNLKRETISFLIMTRNHATEANYRKLKIDKTQKRANVYCAKIKI